MKFLAIIVALFAGLQAVSGAEDCPFDCNSRGTCQDDGTCLCDPGTFGFDCHANVLHFNDVFRFYYSYEEENDSLHGTMELEGLQCWASIGFRNDDLGLM